MNEALIVLIPASIGFALSPIPLVEMILVLLSKRAKTNGLVFLVCIFVPVLLLPLLGAAGVFTATGDSSAESSSTKAWLIIVFGILLAVLALQNYRTRHVKNVPKVFSAIENMGPWAVVALSAGVTIINPKNFVVLVSAGAAVASAGLQGAQLFVSVLLFAVIATVPFIFVVGYVLFGGKKAARNVQIWKTWLIGHNKLIMAVVLGILSAVMIAKALGVLL